MTGCAAGYCAGFDLPGYANPATGGGGRGFFRGRGMGRVRGSGGSRHGWRNLFYATGLPGWARFGMHSSIYPKPDTELEIQALKNQANILKSELDPIENRLAEIKAGTGKQQIRFKCHGEVTIAYQFRNFA